MSEVDRFTFEVSDEKSLQSLLTETRGTRYSWSREHLAAEAAKMIVYAIPIILLFGGFSDKFSVLMYLAGMVIWRVYDGYLRPTILSRLGPGGPDLDIDKRLAVAIDERGVSVRSADFTLRFPWRSVAQIQRFDNGALLRINATACYPFPTRLLPNGTTLEGFIQQMQTWKREASPV